MSKLIEHAENEMRLAGLYDNDAEYGGLIPQAVLALVRAHVEQGHSGGSHQVALAIFNRVVNFRNLMPLTADPAEWINRTKESGGHLTWQNRRNASVFSNDAGKTFYDIDDPEKKNWPNLSRPADPV